MELLVKILEHIFDIASGTFDVFVKFAAGFDCRNCAIGQGKEG